MSLFMKVPNVQGNVSENNHYKWIAIDSVRFDMQRDITARPGNSHSRTGQLTQVSDAMITKPMDQATPQLMSQCCLGKALETVEIHSCHAGQEQLPHTKMVLSNVMFSRYAPTLDKAGAHEQIQLSFTKLTLTSQPRQPDNTVGAAITAGYDIGEGVLL